MLSIFFSFLKISTLEAYLDIIKSVVGEIRVLFVFKIEQMLAIIKIEEIVSL
jgi:hypothetical protein